MLTFHVLNLDYSKRRCSMISWLSAWPGDQQPWYFLCRINQYLFVKGKILPPVMENENIQLSFLKKIKHMKCKVMVMIGYQHNHPLLSAIMKHMLCLSGVQGLVCISIILTNCSMVMPHAIWHQISWSILVNVMTGHLLLREKYLNQCGFRLLGL